jgi:hypothetical protein
MMSGAPPHEGASAANEPSRGKTVARAKGPRLGTTRHAKGQAERVTYTERDSSGGSSDGDDNSKGEEEEPQPRRGDQAPPDRRARETGACEGWAWEVIDPREMGRWDAPPIGKQALRQMTGPVTLVWRVTSQHRMPWVIVAESALLRKGSAELRKGGVEMGLYAWRDFEDGELIGRYTGTESKPFCRMSTRERERAHTQVTTEGGEDMIIEIEVNSTKSKFVNGEKGMAPFLQRANDGGGKNTARMSPQGGMWCTRKKKWDRVTPEGGWEQMEKREITWAYGKAYWKTRKVGGAATEKSTSNDTGQGIDDSPRRKQEGEAEAHGTQEYLTGVLWYDLGKSTALHGNGEERKDVNVMYITEGWVHGKERRKGWMARAMAKEVRAAQGIDEIHLIAQNEEAVKAWEGMGLKAASEEQVIGEWTAYQPGAGETYMAATREEVMATTARREERHQGENRGRTIRLGKCRQTGGFWYEKAAVRAIREWHKNEEGWVLSRTIPGGADGRSRESRAVFMIQQGIGHPEERTPSRSRARPASASGSGRAATPASGRESRLEGETPKEGRSTEPGGASTQRQRTLGECMRGARPEDVGAEHETAGTETRAADDASEAENETAGDVHTEAGEGAREESAREGDNAEAKHTWLMTYNACGLRLRPREINGRRIGGGWGSGTDLRARMTNKAAKIIGELREGGVSIAVLTDTHAAGEELQALEAHLLSIGWGSATTEGYWEGQSTRGGVMIVWDVMQWKIARGASACTVIVPGRVISATLKSVESTATIRVIGVYAPCRGQKEKRRGRKETHDTHEHTEEDEADMWDALEGDMEKGDDIMIVGDMNAETKGTMAGSSREESRQDVRFQQMIERMELTHLSVGRATYRDKSEIDHVLTTASARQYLREPEWRKGQTAGDHGAVWVKMTVAEAEDKAAHGDDRPKGVALKYMEAEEWAEYAGTARTRTQQEVDSEGGEDRVEARIRQRQRILIETAEGVIKRAAQKRAAKNKAKGGDESMAPDDGPDEQDKRGEETERHPVPEGEEGGGSGKDTGDLAEEEQRAERSRGEERGQREAEWEWEMGTAQAMEEEEGDVHGEWREAQEGEEAMQRAMDGEEAHGQRTDTRGESTGPNGAVGREEEGTHNNTAASREGAEEDMDDDTELAALVDQRIEEAERSEKARREQEGKDLEGQQRHNRKKEGGKDRGKNQEEQGQRKEGQEGDEKGRRQQEGDGGKYGRLHREMSRWIRVAAEAPKWKGRPDAAGWKVFGTDSGWVAAQGWARAAAARDTRKHRREALRAAVVMHTEEATKEWADYTRTMEGDILIKAITAAVNAKGKGPASKGGVYVELYKILRAGISGRSELAGDQRVKAVYRGGDKEKGVEAHGAKAVREECKEQGKKINGARPVALAVVRRMIQWMDREGGKREREEEDQEEEGEEEQGTDWVDEVCTWTRFREGLARTSDTKGVGVDGFNAHLLRKAPEEVQRGYWKDLKHVIRGKHFPDEWRERVAMMAMKPGEDPVDLSRRRDLWLECHGSKLTMWLLGAEYEEASGWAIPASQAGAEKKRGCPEQSLVMRFQKEQCAAERTVCCRAYLDFGVFFMSCVREVQWAVEKWCKVKPGVTETVQAMNKSMKGRYETAYGMTDTFEVENGNAQGCSQSPTRSKFQLRMVQEAIRIMCEGFKFRGAKECIPQMWFVDDGAFVADSLATLQLVLDTCWMVTRAAGLKIMIKGIKKTAWQASYWEGDEEKSVEGWQMRLPDGRVVPQVKREKDNTRGEYTYLGSEETERWYEAQEGVKRKVVTFCTKILRMTGRVGVLDGEQTRIGMSLGVEGASGFYARATAIDFETCEEVEKVRAEVLRDRGLTAGQRVQIHATTQAGGLGHSHLYQSAAASLADQIDKIMQDDPGTPASIATRAHIRNTYMRLGWTERQDMMEWHPQHLEHILNEEMIIEAWLLARLRAGVRIRRIRKEGEAEARRPDGVKRGPPIWDKEEGEDWQATGQGPCRTRVGVGKGGGVVVRIATHGRNEGRCEFTHRSRRLAAGGIREWRDITSKEGRWRTPQEIQGQFGVRTGVELEAYRQLIAELDEPRWEHAKEKWFELVKEGRADLPPETTREEEMGVKQITAARRTAKCLGEWELLVEWRQKETEPTWEKEEALGKARVITASIKQAKKEKVVPSSMFERMIGTEMHKRALSGKEWTWRGLAAEGDTKGMSAEECERATAGDLRQEATQQAIGTLWEHFRKHAKEVHGKGRRKAVEKNAPEHAERARTKEGRTRGTQEKRCTMYLGEWETVDTDKEAEGTERKGTQKTKRHKAGLGQTEEDRSEGVRVTAATARQRIEIQERLERSGSTLRAVPKGRPDRELRWDVEEQSQGTGTWKRHMGTGKREKDIQLEGDGYVSQWAEDPLTRMFVRWGAFENGTEHVLATTKDGHQMRVDIDKEERRILEEGGGETSIREANKVAQAAVPMHMDMHFTDVWTTDGSKMTVHTQKGKEVRVACGSYAGIQPRRRHELLDPFYKNLPPDQLDRIGESEEEWHRRRISGGMRGMRLPAHYEVVDAELAAILMVLKEAAEGEGAKRKRCLVMSDCASALRMVETAWRAKGRRAYAMNDRGGMLEAICTYREKLELVVTMYVPAHRGFAANSYADAAAKAACSLEHVNDISGVIKDAIKWKRYVSEVWVQGGRNEGRWEVWDVAPYEAMKEAIGWWVVRKEYNEQKGASEMIDETRIGPKWETYEMGRNEAIWVGTGSGSQGTERTQKDREGKKEEGEVEQIRAEQGTTEVRRIGVAMAARGGNAWQATHGKEAYARRRAEQDRGEEGAATRSFKMGCPACCGRSRGWKWSHEKGSACWVGPAGERVTEHATTMHVMGGQCIAMEHGSALKEAMYKATQELAKATTKHARQEETEQRQQGTPRGESQKKGKVRWRVVATEASNMAHAAKGAVKRGKEATQYELECLRAVLAGNVPRDREGEGSKKEETRKKTAERRAVRAIKDAQEAAARMQEAWYKEAREEIAQRNAEEGMRRWIGPVAGAWKRAQQTWKLNAAGRRVWAERGDKQGEEGDREAEGHTAQDTAETPPHRRGAQVGTGLRYELKKKKRGGRGQEGEGSRGWSMARAIAEYKRWEWRSRGYSDKNEERWRQMMKERWEKEAGKKGGEEADDEDDKTRDKGTGETERYTQEKTEKSGTQSQGKRATETQHEDVGREDHSKRQRGAEESDEQSRRDGEAGGERQKHTRQRDWPEEPRIVEQNRHGQSGMEPTRAEGGDTQGTRQRNEREQDGSSNRRDGEAGGERQKHTRQRDWHEELRSEEQNRHRQRGMEPMRAEEEDTQGTQQRNEREQDGSSTGRKRKGKERLSTHQLEQMVEQPTSLNGMDSSEEEERMVERRRRRQRGSGGSNDQPQESHGTPRTTQEDGPKNAESIAWNSPCKDNSDLSAGGVTVNAGVYVRKNPARRARPQEKPEAKKPGRARTAKGPIFKGTYMPKAGARGGGLKYMIRLGKRAIERMENTYEKTRPPKQGNER